MRELLREVGRTARTRLLTEEDPWDDAALTRLLAAELRAHREGRRGRRTALLRVVTRLLLAIREEDDRPASPDEWK